MGEMEGLDAAHFGIPWHGQQAWTMGRGDRYRRPHPHEPGHVHDIAPRHPDHAQQCRHRINLWAPTRVWPLALLDVVGQAHAQAV